MLLACILGAALSVSVVGASATSARPKATATPIVGGTPAQRTTLRQILTAMGGTLIERIRIVPAGKGRVRLILEPQGPESAPAQIRVRLAWEEQIVSASFFRWSLQRHLPRVVGFNANRRLTLQQPRLLAFDRARIVKPVRRAVNTSAARVVEFNLFRPHQPAFAVVVSAADPAAFIKQRLPAMTAALNRAAELRLDGYYIAVVDSLRSVALAYAAVPRPRQLHLVRPPRAP